MAYSPLGGVTGGNNITEAWGDQVDANFEALNRDPLWLPPRAVGGAAATLATNLGDHAAALIGNATQDGTAYLQGFWTPPDFLAQASGGIVRAVLQVVAGQTGNARLSFSAQWGGAGAAYNAATDAIAAATYALTANQVTEIDISTLFTLLVASRRVGFSVTRIGSDGLDTITDLYVLGAYLQLKQ